MKRITEFLNRFKNLKPPEKTIEEEAKKIIKEKIKISDNFYNIVFKKPNLTIISSDPALKNEIFIHKKNILNQLQNKFGPKTEIKIFFK